MGVDKIATYSLCWISAISRFAWGPGWRMSAAKTIPANATLLGMFTHMHVRGRDMTFIAEYPDGKAVKRCSRSPTSISSGSWPIYAVTACPPAPRSKP